MFVRSPLTRAPRRLYLLPALLLTTCLVLAARAQRAPALPAELAAPAASAPVQALLDGAQTLAAAQMPAEALAEADRALAAAQAARDAPGRARAHGMLGALLGALQRPAEAVAAWEAAAAAWRAAGDGPGEVEALCRQALLGDPAVVDALLTAAIARAHAEARRPRAAASALTDGGIAIYNRGRLGEARRVWTASLAIREKLGPGSLDVAASLNNLGELARQQGNPAGAREYHPRALAIFEKLAPGSLVVAASLNNLGLVAYLQGDLAGAKEYYQRSLVIQEKLAPGSLEVGLSLNNLGLVATDQGDLAGAKAYHERSLAIREMRAPGSLDVAASLNNLGEVARQQEDPRRAREYHRRSLLIRADLVPDTLDVAASLNNLALVAGDHGDPAEAKEYYQRALAIFEKLAPGSLVVAAGLHNLGLVAYLQGDLAGAKEYYQRALAIQERLAPGSLAVAASLHNLGTLASRRNDIVAAVEFFSRAWVLVRKQAHQVSGDESRRAFGRANAFYAANLQQALLARGDRAGALRVLEEGRAQALLQVLAERGLERLADTKARAVHTAAVNVECIARASQGRALDRAQRAEALLADAAGKPEAVRAPLRTVRDAAKQEETTARAALIRRRLETESAWAHVKATAPGAALADPLPFARARAALRPGELFLAYSVGEKETTLFLVPGKTTAPVATFTLPLGEDGWTKEVAGLKRVVTDGATEPAQVLARARTLTTRLLPVAALARVRAAQRVIVSPDGALWEAPFAALVLPRAGREQEEYLGLAKPLVTAQSLSLYARAVVGPAGGDPHSKPALAALTVGGCLFSPTAVAEARAKSGQALAAVRPGSAGYPTVPTGALAGVAAPAGSGGDTKAFALPGGVLLAVRSAGDILRGGESEWAPLPATGPEAARIARLYGGRILSGLSATEAELRHLLGSARVIHLATHGRYHHGDALLSGLILTQPAPGDPVTEATDGVLEASEVLDPGLRLRAEVVVLSGCETARGERTQGEGLVGLTRCWQIAGARSVVASQWSVADASTAALMAAFHRGLQGGLPKDEAMRRAMGELAKTKEWAHPFFWAPFLVTGDPRARKE